MSKLRPLIGASIVLYFIIGLEVLVMISPFAAFFYAAFNPFLLFLTRWPATRWLADFFLPHMVLPPDVFLKALRVTGSVLFVGGALVFLICAGQVYFHKFSRRGPALGGFYAWIRHPQYVGLAITGLGLAILWPRFLTLMLWTVMIGLYYVLARDEERRMMAAFGDQYRAYMSRTGMFLPRRAEELLARIPGPRSAGLRVPLALIAPRLGVLALVCMKVDALAFGGGFASVPLMFHEMVEVRPWLDAKTFMDGIALGQVTPGPIVVTATFVGYRVAGLAGALVATVAMFMPSFVLVVAAAPWFGRLRARVWFAPALHGAMLSFVGLLVFVAVHFAVAVQWSLGSGALAVLALAALRAGVEVLWVVLASGAVAAIVL